MLLHAVPRPPKPPKKYKAILGEDRNMLDLYMYVVGKSEIPDIWHKWCLLSLVAASVGKRVGFPKFGHQPLWPNLFVFLVGPSALGKGAAIGHMLQLEHLRHNVLNGAATHKALVDRFSLQAPADHPGYETVFLLHEELGNSVPSGPLGKAFIKFITDAYLRAGEYYTDATRKGGEVKFPRPCINWLAGSTPEWLGESVTIEDMLSGFFGRVIAVPAWYNFNHRVYMPSRYDVFDRDEVIDYLCQRIHYLTTLPEGSLFEMTPHAQEVDEHWYMSRPEPEDSRLYPFWRRESDLALKLGMILSLCDNMSLRIDVEHIVQAHELVREAREAMPKIVQWASQSTLSQQEKLIEQFLQQRQGQWIRRKRLLEMLTRHSVSGKTMLEMLENLEMRGTVISRKAGNSTEYRWEDQGRYFKFG